MTLHDDKHEALLVELLTTSDARRAFEQSELRSCEPCREIVDAHLALEAKLGALGADEREVLSAARSEIPAGEGRAEAALRKVIAADLGKTGQPPRRHAWLWPILAAAAVLIAVFLWRSEPSQPIDPNPPLGPGEWEVEPKGPVEDFSYFSWDAELGEAEWFDVVIYRLDDELGLVELHREESLRQNEWEPGTELHTAWPDEIYWTLEIRGGDIDLRGSPTRYSARRLPR